MKKMLIVASNRSTVNAVFDYLDNIFGDYCEIERLLIKEIDDETDSKYDLIVFPGEPDDKTPSQFIHHPKALFTHRIINYKNIKGIFDLDPNSRIYLVNDSRGTVDAIMSQIRNVTGMLFDLVPFYPGCTCDLTVRQAITAGETESVPEHVNQIIDLGSRVPNLSDIGEISRRLDLPLNIINSITQEYLQDFMEIVKRSNIQMKQLFSTQQILKNVFNNVIEGICMISFEGTIKMINNKFIEMLFSTKANFVGENLMDKFSRDDLMLGLDDLEGEGVIVTNYRGKDILLNSYELDARGEESYIVYAHYIDRINEKEYIVRKKSGKTAQVKRYSFKDYITCNEEALSMLERAKKIAQNNSNVLIQGETGTGKEILAQAIHYHSYRKRYPFVPVNFAAIQPALLESELFGYVEGSFTGAIKGGSKGLFEMAHRGTLFFDEIGDAPLNFQVRLLRVLEEKEIRKIGSSERIPIDVRIVAATNKNIFELVKRGEFREDLFYRLNIMPIDTIPVRDRKGDIPRIFNYFIKDYFNDMKLDFSELFTEKLQEFFLLYSFRGNVREVKNIIEYFSCIKGVDKLCVSDLPKYMLEPNPESQTVTLYEKRLLEIIESNPKIGRYKMHTILQADINLSEGEIRTMLKKLQDKKLIVINNTRGGCEITQLGEMTLGAIRQI